MVATWRAAQATASSCWDKTEPTMAAVTAASRSDPRWQGRKPRPALLREGANPGQRCSGGALHQSGELLSIQACAVCLPNGPSLDDDLRRYASPGRGWFRGRSIGLPSPPGTIPASRVPRVSPSHRKRGTKCHRTSCHQSSELCRRCSNFSDASRHSCFLHQHGSRQKNP